MSRTQESGAYLGGIGAMLEVSHGCPACGQVHEGRQFGFNHRAPRECPLVAVGSFPVVSVPSPPGPAPVKVLSARRAPESEPRSGAAPLFADSLPIVQLAGARDGDRTRGLTVPWLLPPDLGEVL